MVQKLALNEFERARILEIFSTVTAADRQRFKFLSDEPFSNEAGMFEQFEDSRVKIAEGFANWEDSAGAAEIGDGTRVVHVFLQSKVAGDPQIILTLHSAGTKISIWTFHQDFRLSDLYVILRSEAATQPFCPPDRASLPKSIVPPQGTK